MTEYKNPGFLSFFNSGLHQPSSQLRAEMQNDLLPTVYSFNLES